MGRRKHERPTPILPPHRNQLNRYCPPVFEPADSDDNTPSISSTAQKVVNLAAEADIEDVMSSMMLERMRFCTLETVPVAHSNWRQRRSRAACSRRGGQAHDLPAGEASTSLKPPKSRNRMTIIVMRFRLWRRSVRSIIALGF